VAECVETEAQKDFLVGVKCDEIQGYYYSKPVVEKEVLELLQKYNGEGSCHKSKRITA
jgi:EAL domain-containing protein (putative c-di-GMP-specific phosphodiesterase class I)